MANYKSSILRIRKSEVARARNKHYKSRMRTAIKKVLATQDKANSTQSLLDKLVSKGIIHKNKASNQKARLSRYVNSL